MSDHDKPTQPDQRPDNSQTRDDGDELAAAYRRRLQSLRPEAHQQQADTSIEELVRRGQRQLGLRDLFGFVIVHLSSALLLFFSPHARRALKASANTEQPQNEEHPHGHD